MPGGPRRRRRPRPLGPEPGAEVDEELRFHLDSRTDDLIAQGLRPEAARQEAERQFGELGRLRALGEELGEARRRRRSSRQRWEDLRQDLRQTCRALRREPGFAAITVLLLGLGIGANTAVFSVVDALWLRPLPFANPGQLAWLESGRGLSAKKRKTAGLSAVTYTVGVFEELQERSRSFPSLTSYNPFFGNSEYTLRGRGEPQSVAGVMVAANFFPSLGVQPVLGRSFAAEECRQGGPRRPC